MWCSAVVSVAEAIVVVVGGAERVLETVIAVVGLEKRIIILFGTFDVNFHLYIYFHCLVGSRLKK